MARIAVTPRQARAAQLEVDVLRSAGLEPDPAVVEIAALLDKQAPVAAEPSDDLPAPSVRRAARRRTSAATGVHAVAFELPPGYRVITSQGERAGDREVADSARVWLQHGIQVAKTIQRDGRLVVSKGEAAIKAGPAETPVGMIIYVTNGEQAELLAEPDDQDAVASVDHGYEDVEEQELEAGAERWLP